MKMIWVALLQRHITSLLHVNAPKTFGGTGLLVKSQLYESYDVRIVDKSYDGILVVLFQDKQSDFSFIIFSCYLPPEGSVYANATNFFAHILTLLYLHQDTDLMFICGDFNGRIGKHTDVSNIDDLPSREVIDDKLSGHGESLLEFLNDGKLCVLNGRFDSTEDNYTCISHKGNSVVDYIMTPHDCFFKCTDFKVLCSNELVEKYELQGLISTRCKPPDHSLLTCNFQTMHSLLYSNEHFAESDLRVNDRKRHRFNNVPNDFMNNEMWRATVSEMIDMCIETSNQQAEIDVLYDKFCDVICHEMDTYLKYTTAQKKTRKKFKNSKPFWNDQLTELWKDMNSKEHLFRKCKGNKKEKTFRRESFLNSRKIFDKELRKAERSYNKGLLNEIETICTENPRAFWDHIKKLGPRKAHQIPMEVYQGSNLVADTDTVLNTWRNDFSNLYNKPQNMNAEFNDTFYEDILQQKHLWEVEMNQSTYVSNALLNRDISFDEVEKMTQRLKNNKACGFDSIPNEVLKRQPVHLFLFNFYKLLFNYGLTPSIWLKSIITPIPKSSTKDPYIPLNYRGISLLSCVCKGYSNILNQRAMTYCEELNIFADEQNGFRHDRSCTDHIFTLTSIVQNRMAESLPTFACFIDMQKAFDWIDRDLLFFKLLQNNIDGKFYNSIKSLYSNPVARVKLNSYYTDWFDTTSGVKQGDSLSPTLFCIFINDLIKDVNDQNLGIKMGNACVSLLAFADDIVLIAENEENLQNLLDIVYCWCNNWRVIVNKDKTKVMHFRKNRHRKSNYSFMYGSSKIEMVDTYKYLGVVLSDHLKHSVIAEVLASAGGRALGAVITKFRNFRNIGFSTFTKMYDTSVVPVMNYASEVWGYKEYNVCEKVQQRAIRYFLGVHSKSPLLSLEGDMGWENLQSRRHINMVKYWNRMVNMSNTRLTKCVFLYDKSVCKNNWSHDIKLLFEELGIEESFSNGHEIDLEMLSKEIAVHDNDTWKCKLQHKPKLRTYVQFKETFETEEYVRHCSSRRKRSLLAQFRMSILPIALETGRFKGLPIEERICKLCDRNAVEDEIHVLCSCDLYHSMRDTMYNRITQRHENFVNLDNESKFQLLMRFEWKEVAEFLDQMWNVRTGKLYGVNT